MHKSKLLRLLALLLALSLVAAACGGDDDDDGDAGVDVEDDAEVQTGGTFIFGAEQEPSEGLFSDLVCCTLFWGSMIQNTILAGAYEVSPDFEYIPDIIEADPEVEEDPFALTYTIKEEAQWSDGTPITADDFIFTVDAINNEEFNFASRTGYELITKSEAIDEKTVRFEFSEPYAPYKDALFDPVLPAHALDGENLNKVWNEEFVNPKTGEPIGSGPFLFDSYKKGNELVTVRNENYWGEHKAYLDSVVWKFVPETNTEIQTLRGGEVDMIYPQPQLALAELATEANIEIEASLGTTWEHIDFQYSNDLLAQDFVRQAIAHGIDRESIITSLIGQIKPDAEVLHNMVWMANSANYEPHFDMWNFDPDKAMQLLEDNGCTKGADGIYECDGEPLSFSFKSTTGNELRELQFQLIQSQLKDVGIEVQNDFGDAAVVFGNKGLVGGNYELFGFAWVGSPDPQGSVEIHKCEGSQNFQNYCNEEVTELLDATNTEVDEAERARMFNEADALMAQDLPILPLYQKPTFLAFSSRAQNMIDNASQEGPTWNIEDWWLEK